MYTVAAVEQKLRSVFPERQATVLAETIVQAYNDLVKTGDFNELKGIVADLAAAQKRTEHEVAELGAAQKRTEIALGRLAKQVGGLSDAIGGDIEDIAYIVVHDVLQREFGWQVGRLERVWQKWNGVTEEIDLFGRATDPAHPDQVIWIVGEAKHNLTLREVRKFVRQVERARNHLSGTLFPVCFCYRARPEVVEEVRQAGIRLIYSYGKLA